MEEESKAVQEVAKTTGKAIEAAERVGKFLSTIFGGAFGEVGDIVHDWAKYFHYKNLLRIQDRVEAIHRERKIEGKTIPIPPRYAVPLIQSASQEDDETLQEMWAGLIANGMDPGKRLNVKKVYINILSSLEPFDVQLLNFLAAMASPIAPGLKRRNLNMKTLGENLSVTQKELELSLQNLARLGCVIDEFPETWDSIASSSVGIRIRDPKTTFMPSPLGYSLIEACKD